LSLKGAKSFYFGFCYLHRDEKNETPEVIGDRFRTVFGNQNSTESWHAWAWWQEYRYWNSDTYLKVYNGEIARQIKEKVVRMLDLLS